MKKNNWECTCAARIVILEILIDIVGAYDKRFALNVSGRSCFLILCIWNLCNVRYHWKSRIIVSNLWNPFGSTFVVHERYLLYQQSFAQHIKWTLAYIQNQLRVILSIHYLHNKLKYLPFTEQSKCSKVYVLWFKSN